MNGKLNKEYNPIDGDAVFNKECAKVVFGDNNPLLKGYNLI